MLAGSHPAESERCLPVRPSPRKPYHHGDLRNALLEEATRLAREGGPSAIVLREAARRTGVSPNAAYAHFRSLPDLVAGVAERSMGRLARHMEHEMAERPRGRDPEADAVEALSAIGRGYVHFALSEPGLFRTAFEADVLPIGEHQGVGESGLTPIGLLESGLDGMVQHGRLSPAGRRRAVPIAWSAMHGLAVLLLGPLAGMPEEERTALIRETVDMVVSRT